jgi:hypothetical protein
MRSCDVSFGILRELIAYDASDAEPLAARGHRFFRKNCRFNSRQPRG